MRARFEAGRTKTVRLVSAFVFAHNQRMSTVPIHFDEQRIGRQTLLGALEITAKVLIFERMKGRHIVAVVDDRVQVRRHHRGRGVGLRPAPPARDGRALIGDVHCFDLRKSCGAAHSGQTFGRRTAPVVDLSAELGPFVKFHHRGDLPLFGLDDEGFDEREIGRQLDDLLQPKQRMPQVIEHTEEQDDIETSELSRREFVHVERKVFDVGPDQLFGLDEGIEGDAVDRDDVGAAALAFEAEPSVPGAYVENALAAKVVRQSKELEPPAQVLDGLQSWQYAAVGKVDRVITEARLDPIGEHLDALFEAAVSGGNANFGFRHQASGYCTIDDVLKPFLLALALCFAAEGENPPPIIDNERVTVWDVTSAMAPAEYDFVAVPLSRKGAAVFGHKGDTPGEAGSRTIVIELKDHPVAPLANKSGYPNAFPRPHVKKLLENDRVIVWSYAWKPGEATPMHFHDKDVVVVYEEDTALKSTTPDGKVTVNEYKSGQTKFNARDRTHTELLIRGTGSAVMTELK